MARKPVRTVDAGNGYWKASGLECTDGVQVANNLGGSSLHPQSCSSRQVHIERAWLISRQERRKKSRELVLAVGRPFAIPVVQMAMDRKWEGGAMFGLEKQR